PMNLNFDARGRLWVTHSVEYPYPAKSEGVEERDPRFQGPSDGHPPRDRVTIVEAIGSHGRASRVTHFAQGLNIPIGHTPLGDGSSALVYSIPSIFRHTDADGDGVADRQKKVYSGFGNRDTHGMVNSLTRWIDGWIYGCHGFSNTSEVRDAGGHIVKMTSGNTYRFREDGSHFQQRTWGQVNPFGMVFDPLGDLYDSDCHSMPVYMLLRGATYPHFGSQPTGLGFGPTMIDHNHGSTGICGPAYYAADHFPADYRDNLFICNPVTGRVHRDKLKTVGSTRLVDTQPDFIRCEDPWFRPVDARVGPDGALYIADFYNAIIGHYEVELQHPKRDRTRGRVWRIVYRGENGSAEPPRKIHDLTKSTVDELVALLGNPNLSVRTPATNYLVDAFADAAAEAVRPIVESGTATQRAHGLWILERRARLDAALVEKLAADSDRLVRVHLLRALAEREKWRKLEADVARSGLADADPFVRRVAADAIGQHPDIENVRPLLAAWEAAQQGDTHLLHVIQMALADHMRSDAIVTQLRDDAFEQTDRKRLLEIAAVAKGAASARYFLDRADSDLADAALLTKAVPQIIEYGDLKSLERLVKLVRKPGAGDFAQFRTLSTIVDAIERRGQRPAETKVVRDWFAELAPRLVGRFEDRSAQWRNHPVPGLPVSASPWGLRQRNTADGKSEVVIDSIVNGEKRTGIYRSSTFAIPAKLSFWMCGQNGFPGTNPPPTNHILLKLAETGKVVAKAIPPRHDTARKFEWDLSEHAGQQGILEIVDADAGKAFAWIGVGRFQPPVVRVPVGRSSADDAKVLAMIGRFEFREYADRIFAVAADENRPTVVQVAAIEAANRLGAGARVVPVLLEYFERAAGNPAIGGAVIGLLGKINHAAAREALVGLLPRVSAGLQRQVGLALCNAKAGAQQLLKAAQTGKASPRLLQDPQLAERFSLLATPEMQAAAKRLVAELPPVEEHVAKLTAERLQAYSKAKVSAQRGMEVFKKNCAACHRIGKEGELIGPQLDGIGIRGLARLLEDILDPNRNVDEAFRTIVVATVDGKVVTGLKRRQEGQVLVLAANKGEEVRIPLDDVDEQKTSRLSLMPVDLAEKLKPQEFNDLMALLLEQRQEPVSDQSSAAPSDRPRGN
ncbi:MAG: hypothetical protein CMJ48_07490, partial [Planctomycetaceae bacterium]|nr:hypothetical protein [Planctomycetaceae bacterium]